MSSLFYFQGFFKSYSRQFSLFGRVFWLNMRNILTTLPFSHFIYDFNFLQFSLTYSFRLSFRLLCRQFIIFLLLLMHRSARSGFERLTQRDEGSGRRLCMLILSTVPHDHRTFFLKIFLRVAWKKKLYRFFFIILKQIFYLIFC